MSGRSTSTSGIGCVAGGGGGERLLPPTCGRFAVMSDWTAVPRAAMAIYRPVKLATDRSGCPCELRVDDSRCSLTPPARAAPRQIVTMALGFEHLVVATSTQCYVYSVSAWNTPCIMDLKDPPTMVALADRAFVLVSNLMGIAVRAAVHHHRAVLNCAGQPSHPDRAPPSPGDVVRLPAARTAALPRAARRVDAALVVVAGRRVRSRRGQGGQQECVRRDATRCAAPTRGASPSPSRCG